MMQTFPFSGQRHRDDPGSLILAPPLNTIHCFPPQVPGQQGQTEQSSLCSWRLMEWRRQRVPWRSTNSSNHFCKATVGVLALSPSAGITAAAMFWKGNRMPKQYTTVGQPESRASPFCLFVLIFVSEPSSLPPSLPPPTCVSVCYSANLPALSSPFLCNSQHKRRDFLGMSAGSLFLLTPSVVHLFIQKNKITASWPAGPGRPACVRENLFFNWMVHYDEIASHSFHQQILSVSWYSGL